MTGPRCEGSTGPSRLTAPAGTAAPQSPRPISAPRSNLLLSGEPRPPIAVSHCRSPRPPPPIGGRRGGAKRARGLPARGSGGAAPAALQVSWGSFSARLGALWCGGRAGLGRRERQFEDLAVGPRPALALRSFRRPLLGKEVAGRGPAASLRGKGSRPAGR